MHVESFLADLMLQFLQLPTLIFNLLLHEFQRHVQSVYVGLLFVFEFVVFEATFDGSLVIRLVLSWPVLFLITSWWHTVGLLCC